MWAMGGGHFIKFPGIIAVGRANGALVGRLTGSNS